MLPRFVTARPLTRRLLPLLILGAVALFAMPSQARATLCAGDNPGEVVFIGSVIDAPVDSLFGTYEGVYRFSIDEVIAGDPGDGRAYNPHAYGGGGYEFHLGALYEVHANRRTDELGAPGADLATGSCFAIRTLADGPGRTLFGIVRWGVVALGPWILAVALILLARMLVRRGSSAVGRSTPAIAE